MVMKRQADRDRDSPSRMKRNRGRSPNRRSFREINSPEYRERDGRFTSRDARRNISQNRRKSPYISPKYSPPMEVSRGRRGRDNDYYTTLSVHNFSSQLSSADIEESLYYEFKKFGDLSLRVTKDYNGERIAYATFRSPESAKACKNAKGHLVMHDRRLSIEIAHDYPADKYSPRRSLPREKLRSPPRQRSPPLRSPPVRRHSPPPKRSYQRGRSPLPARERYQGRDRMPYSSRDNRDRFSPRERSPYVQYSSPEGASPRNRDYSPDNKMSPRNRSLTPRSSSEEKSPVRKYRNGSRDGGSPQSSNSGSRGSKKKSIEKESPEDHQQNQNNQNNMAQGGMNFGMPFQDPNFFPPGGLMDKPIPPEDDPYATRTLFVGNLEPDVSNYDIRKVFEVYGRVDDVDVKRAARGVGSYCFVRFSNLDQAYKAKIALNGKAVIKNTVRVGYGKVMLSSKVWVGGLGSWTTLSDLEREFDRFGAIRRIDYRKGATSASILFETIDAAQAACNQMRGFLMPNAETRLRMDFLDPEQGMPGFEAFSEWGRHEGKNYDSGSQKYGGSNDRYQDKRNNSRYRGRNIFVDDKGSKGRRRSRSPSRRSRDRSSRSSKNHPKSSNDIKESEMTAMQFKHFHAKKCSSLHELCQVFDPPCWQGGFVLKNIAFPVLFFFLDGDMGVFNTTTADPNSPTGRQTMFHLNQRLKLNEEKTTEISRRMKSCTSKTCLIVAVPGVPENLNTSGTVVGPVTSQHKPLRGLVKYFKEKESAGIVSIPAITTETPKEYDKTSYKERPLSGVLHIFPPGPFAHEQLLKIGPNLQPQYFADDYMVALLVKGQKSVLV